MNKNLRLRRQNVEARLTKCSSPLVEPCLLRGFLLAATVGYCKNKLLFLFCHHIGKGKENNAAPSKNDVLGSQGIESACRTVLMLKKRADSKRVLTVVKGNHLPEEVKNQGIVLEFDPK